MAWILSAFADEAGESTDEQIAALNRAGIDHIDPRSVDGHNIVELPVDLARQVKARYDQAGIRVNMYGSPIGKIDIADDFQTDVKRLEHLAKMRDVFGSNKVRIFSYYNNDGAPEADWKAESTKRLIELAKLADKLDLVLYHENEKHIFGDYVRNVAVLRDEVHASHSERFKMIFDFDNYNQSGEDVWAAWQELRDTTEAIHLKESMRQADGSYQHVPAGTGDGRVPEVLQDAAELRFDGPLTREPHLAHSAAVMATGPSGQANQSLKDMSPADCFQVAADHAINLIKQVGKR